MKLRRKRKQFWWTWRNCTPEKWSHCKTWFDWGMGRIKHQIKNKVKGQS